VLRRTLIILVVAASLSTVFSISAAPQAWANPGPCPGGVTNVGYTIKDGDTIRGSGSMACPEDGWGSTYFTLTVTLWRKVSSASWRKLDTNSITSSNDPLNWRLSVAFNCSDDGRHTYRTQVRGVYSRSGLDVRLTSNTITVTC
jgi:hypothetical protein